MIRISENDRDRIIELLHGIDSYEPDDGWWETSDGVKFGSKILQEIKSILSINVCLPIPTPIMEVYKSYDENDNFIAEKERLVPIGRVIGSNPYPIDDGSGVYFSDGNKGLCILPSRCAVWTLRHYAHKYFEEVPSNVRWDGIVVR
jgi:hypothetical protein